MWRSSGTAVGSVNASEKRASNVRESDGVCDGRCLAMSFDGEEAEEGITHSNCRYVDGGMLRQPTVLLPLLPPDRKNTKMGLLAIDTEGRKEAAKQQV
ncbi:unnamed protein product [Lactuca saligna]|uniref:Uncharacterized protein n=1 Tax=Lactuca saligna TaxID=75948 RepID=A0AA35ZMB9_LACSI|nr:unnamed protein product [Lactuca saligna]